METHSVAIIGLGRVGKIFLEKALEENSVMIVRGVCEQSDTPGKQLAEKVGIPVLTLEEVVSLGVGIDIIFDLTGSDQVSIILRRMIAESGNSYTQVAQSRLARLVWSFLAGDEYLPDVGSSKYQAYADMLLSGKSPKVQAG